MATAIQLLVVPAMLLGRLDRLTPVYSLNDNQRNPAGIEMLVDETGRRMRCDHENPR